MTKRSKGFVHLLFIILIVIAGIGVVGYFAYENRFATLNFSDSKPSPSTSNDKTTNWKKYVNKNLNYEISIPPQYEINSYGDRNADGENPGTPHEYDLWIYISKPEEKLPKDKVMLMGFINFKYPNPNLVKVDELINDIKFEKYYNSAGNTVWYIPINPKQKKPEFFIEVTTGKIDEETVKQILSTFKFKEIECQTGEELKECKLGPCCCPIGAVCD